MSSENSIFAKGAKVVISPDELRAWVILPLPGKGENYTVKSVKEWLAKNRVVHGVKDELIHEAIESAGKDDLLEVARGTAPVAGTRGSYKLLIDNKKFTGLRGGPDGSLFYDDLSFLQEAEAGTILAEVVQPDEGLPGMTVTGEKLEQKKPEESVMLDGSGFDITDGGKYYRAPSLSHVSVVGDRLIVTPLLKLETVTGDDGIVDFDGNILIEKDLLGGSTISATGSIFVAGRAAGATVKAGRNVLFSNGMRSAGGFGKIEAKENVWGLLFESVEITAGGDLSTNQLTGCEVKVNGRANILGGRGMILNTHLYAREGAAAAVIGGKGDTGTVVSVGMGKDLIERLDGVEKRILKLNSDLTAMQQNISALERVSRNKPDKGKNDPTYKEMISKRDNALSVLNILNKERTRIKRSMNVISASNVVVRDIVYPGVIIMVDTREYEVRIELRKVRFRRDGETVEMVSAPLQ